MPSLEQLICNEQVVSSDGSLLSPGGLGVNTPSDSSRSGQGRFYVLKGALRTGIPLSVAPSSAPAHLVSLAVHDAPQRAAGLGVVAGRADARGSGRCPPVADAALLSMGHNPSPSTPHPAVVRLWLEGTRADCPSIPSLRPGDGKTLKPGNDSKRGKVTEFTAKSRRNLVRKLATLKTSTKCFTMALTLPGTFDHLTSDVTLEAFAKLERGYSAKSRIA